MPSRRMMAAGEDVLSELRRTVCNRVMPTMGSQMSAFVGRSTTANAARQRLVHRLLWLMRVLGVPFVVVVDAESSRCQGQYERAMTVRVVSRELEKVRVEQNHCHGLASCMRSCAVLVWKIWGGRGGELCCVAYSDERDETICSVDGRS